MLEGVRGILFDMDGVLYQGTQRLPGVLEFFEWMKKRHLPHLFVTNNATRTPQQVAERLQQMAIPALPDEVLTSAVVTAEYLQQIASPGTPVYGVGEVGLQQALTEHSFVLVENQPRYVVVGLDRQFNEEKLALAVAALQQGAELIATNRDMALMTEQGRIPGAGTIVAQIEAASGHKATVIGKPERRMFENAAQRLGLPLNALAMIGDNLETDIRGAKNAGMVAIMVLTGIHTREEAQVAAFPPDVIANDLLHLTKFWDGLPE